MELQQSLEAAFVEGGAEELIRRAYLQFGDRLVATSSFQTQSVPLLKIISRVAPELRILFLDTGFHFPETIQFMNECRERFGLNVVRLESLIGHRDFLAEHGKLYETNPHMCCYLNKVEPLQRALKDCDAWLSGIRRDQTSLRRDSEVVSRQADGRWKICPMLEWTEEMVSNYIRVHGLPQHPLHDAGYLSIGCAPCTQPVAAGQSPREGRWAGREKTECGIHVENGRVVRN